MLHVDLELKQLRRIKRLPDEDEALAYIFLHYTLSLRISAPQAWFLLCVPILKTQWEGSAGLLIQSQPVVHSSPQMNPINDFA